MKRCKKRSTCKGTYTVEAALVFPIVFFIILLLLNYTFYCYDRVKLHSELDDIVRKAGSYMGYEIGLVDQEVDRIEVCDKKALSLFFDDRQPKESNLTKYIQDRLSSGYYIMDMDEIEVSSSFSKVNIQGIVNMRFYGLSWMNRIFDEPFTFTFHQSIKTFPREEKARLLETIISLGSRIKGVEEKINQLAKLIGYIH